MATCPFHLEAYLLDGTWLVVSAPGVERLLHQYPELAVRFTKVSAEEVQQQGYLTAQVPDYRQQCPPLAVGKPATEAAQAPPTGGRRSGAAKARREKKRRKGRR